MDDDPQEPEVEDRPAPGLAKAILVSTPFVMLAVLFLLERWLRG